MLVLGLGFEPLSDYLIVSVCLRFALGNINGNYINTALVRIVFQLLFTSKFYLLIDTILVTTFGDNFQ
jgi:hypothetical protein